MAYLNPEEVHLELTLYNGDKELMRQRANVTKARVNKRTGKITVFTDPVVFKFKKNTLVTHYAFGLLGFPSLCKTSINQKTGMEKDLCFTFDWSNPKRPTIVLH